MTAGANTQEAIITHLPSGSEGDPLGLAARRIALVVACNQPLYPLYLHWMVGNGALEACGTWLSTPGFLSVVLLARRHSLGARILLVLVGAANTVWSAKLLGAGSGVGLFLVPCFVIALLGMRRDEWLALVALVAVVGTAWALLTLIGASPFARLDAVQLMGATRINLISSVSLTIFAGWMLGRVRFNGQGRLSQ